jgi:hypothetical protein
MAKNTGRRSRIGSVKNRTQVQNPKTGRYVKRDTTTGQFIRQKSDDKPFKGVAKEPDERLNAKHTGRGSQIGSVKGRTQSHALALSAHQKFNGTVNCLRGSHSLTTQEFIERFAGSMPDFPEVEKLEVQERESW